MYEPVAGKFLLEILTRGMYSNPMHIYREYIQNASDSIDCAISTGIIKQNEAEIHINFSTKDRSVSIRDNGIGVNNRLFRKTLLDVGASFKEGINERGFRGIGRLGGLAYADQVQFISSARGDSIRTTMTCDCVRLQQLLQKANTETSSIIETFLAISHFKEEEETQDEHFFEVRLLGVHQGSALLEEEDVINYLRETAPIDFDTQQFSQAPKIRKYFEDKGFPISCYRILRGSRKLPIYKFYKRNIVIGQRKASKENDYIRDIKLFYDVASDGSPLYIGWIAITDFSGTVSEEAIQGIRFRKGNILVGDGATLAKFFPLTPLEASRANKFFVGEFHILHNDLIPNSQRDDFEPGPVYNELKEKLSDILGDLNRQYRRGTSEANSALKKLRKLNDEKKILEENLKSGVITSDEKREQLTGQLDQIERGIGAEGKKVRKGLERGSFSPEQQETVNNALNQAETDKKAIPQIRTKILGADYSTKNDLPTSYSREERKLYQRIIAIIDSFFSNDPQIADDLRKKIKQELREKKK